jgi:hypothetical protein
MDIANDLVTEYEGKLGLGQIPIDNMEVGPTDATGGDSNHHLLRSAHRQLALDES